MSLALALFVTVAAGVFVGDVSSAPAQSYPYHRSIETELALRMLLNGTLMPSTSVILMHVTCATGAPQASSSDDEKGSSASALCDLRHWMDDAFGCSSEEDISDATLGNTHTNGCGGVGFVHVPVLREADLGTVMSTMNVSCSDSGNRSSSGGVQEWHFLLSPPPAPRTAQLPIFERTANKTSKKLSKKKKKDERTPAKSAANVQTSGGWWPSWDDTRPSRRATDADGTNVWEMPMVMRDVFNAVAAVDGASIFDNTTLSRLMVWKVHRGMRLGSAIGAARRDEENKDGSGGASGVGRRSAGKGGASQAVVKVRARRVEQLDLAPAALPRSNSTAATNRSSLSFVDSPKGLLLLEARHVALLLFCRASSELVVHWEERRSELATAAKNCWETIHRSQRRHAVLHVLEHELLKRIPNHMPVLVPTHRHSTSDHKSAAAQGDDSGVVVDQGVQVDLAADSALVLPRVDSLEDLRHALTRTASMIPAEWGSSLPLHVTAVTPLEPQRVLLLRWNVAALITPPTPSKREPLRIDRWALKIQALLTSPQYYGRVRALYSIVHPDIPLAATARTMDRLFFGEAPLPTLGTTTRANDDVAEVPCGEGLPASGVVHIAALPSLGSQLPLTPRSIIPDGPPSSGSHHSFMLSSLSVITTSLLDASLPPAHHRDSDLHAHPRDVAHPHATFAASRQDALSSYTSAPLRRLTSLATWTTHVVEARQGIVVIALLPLRNATLHPPTSTSARSSGGGVVPYAAAKNVMKAVADHFLPIRSARKVVTVFRMGVPVLDVEGRVVAHPVTSTTSASSFEDHVGQVLMKSARVRRLPAAMVFVPSRRAPGSRHWIAVGEGSTPQSQKKRPGLKKDLKAQPLKSTTSTTLPTLQSLWTTKKLIAAIRNASLVAEAASAGQGDSYRGGASSRYVGSLSDAKLGAVGLEAHNAVSATSSISDSDDRGNTFANAEGWSSSSAEAEPSSECDIGSIECTIDPPRWRIPAALKKRESSNASVQSASQSGQQRGDSLLKSSSMHEGARDLATLNRYLRDVLNEPQASKLFDGQLRRSGDDDQDHAKHFPLIGWHALRRLQTSGHGDKVNVLDI